MPFDPGRFTLTELRRRFTAGGQLPGPTLLRRMREDPRAGVRDLAEVLARRRGSSLRRRRDLASLLALERQLRSAGLLNVAGVDEAGIGPLAGPVVAAAVIFPPELAITGVLTAVDDSKRVPAELREAIAGEIRRQAAGVGVGIAEVEEIDRLNIYHAGLLAMRRAVEALPVEPDHLLTDARRIPGITVPQSPVIGGDRTHFSIAAASIIAKTHRDHLLEELDALYPAYGFARHKGYPTPAHQEAVRRLGPCPAHRRSFALIREVLGEDLPLLRHL